MKFKSITCKNFMSIGNQPITVQLDSHKSTLIVGKNGVGKCTHPTTEIEITFENNEVEEKFKEFLLS